jgi:hypothetical protein
MKRSFVIFISVAVVFPYCVSAQEKDFGVGAILGEPAGLSLKKWLGEKTAIDGALAWSFAEKGAFHLHAGYLVHNFSLIQVKKGKLPVYYGIGARIKSDKDFTVSARLPFGISYLFEKAPIDIFFEFALLLDITPGSKFWLNSGIGFRYYF